MGIESLPDGEIKDIREQLKNLRDQIEVSQKAEGSEKDDVKKVEITKKREEAVEVSLTAMLPLIEEWHDKMSKFRADNPGVEITHKEFKKLHDIEESLIGSALSNPDISYTDLLTGLTEGSVDLKEMKGKDLDNEIKKLMESMGAKEAIWMKLEDFMQRTGLAEKAAAMGVTFSILRSFLAEYLASAMEGGEWRNRLGFASIALRQDHDQNQARAEEIPEEKILEATKKWEPLYKAWVKKPAASAGDMPSLIDMIREEAGGAPSDPEKAKEKEKADLLAEYQKHADDNDVFGDSIIQTGDTMRSVLDGAIKRIVTITADAFEKDAKGTIKLSEKGEKFQKLYAKLQSNRDVGAFALGSTTEIKPDGGKLDITSDGDILKLDVLLTIKPQGKIQKVNMITADMGFGSSTPFAKIENGTLSVNDAALNAGVDRALLVTTVQAELKPTMMWKFETNKWVEHTA